MTQSSNNTVALFSHAHNFSISGGAFHSAGRDINVYYSQPATIHSAFTVGSLDEIVATGDLIVKIIAALRDRSEISRAFVSELELYSSLLKVTSGILKAYGGIDLGVLLLQRIQREIAECRILLGKFLQNLDSYRDAFVSKGIGNAWRKVFWYACEPSEVAVVRERLGRCQQKLSMLLGSLNSNSSKEVGDALRTGYNGGKAVKNAFSHKSYFRRIDEITLSLLDPLGRTIQVPLSACYSWEGFHRVLSEYLRITPARPYVEVGEYQLSYFQEAERDEVHEETRQRGDWHVIKRSEFANIVRAGMELEMSIIIRKAWESWRPLARKCPLCQYQNRGITSEPWITCIGCNTQFRVGEEKDKDDNEEIVSPETQRSGTRDDAAFFRRISVRKESEDLRSDSPDSPGTRYLEEELYKLRQRPRSSSQSTHQTWEISAEDWESEQEGTSPKTQKFGGTITTPLHDGDTSFFRRISVQEESGGSDDDSRSSSLVACRGDSESELSDYFDEFT